MAADGQTISVACNHCGAPLQVESATRFVTCAYCKSQLEIKRTGSSYFTSVLERIDQNTQSIAENVEAIRLQHELERVDREWEKERGEFATRDKNGNIVYPQASSAIGGIVGIGFGILWTIITCAMMGSAPNEGPFPIVKVVFPLFGVLFVIVGVVSTIKRAGTADTYKGREEAYRARRDAIRQQLDRTR